MFLFQRSIKAYIAWAAGAIIVATIALTSALTISLVHMHASSAKMRTDAKSIELSYRLENAILGHRRVDLLRQLLKDERYAQESKNLLREAELLIQQLEFDATTQTEKERINAVEKTFYVFSAAAVAATEPADRMGEKTEALLKTVHEYRIQNRLQMEEVFLNNRATGDIITIGSLCVTAGVVVIMAGLWLLTLRFIRPLLALGRTAERLWAGDLRARVQEDATGEVGMLCSRFNAMADAVVQRDKDRLEILGSIVHDIRNPVIVIGAALHMLKKRCVQDSSTPWHDKIHHQVKALDGMTHDAMNVIQAATGRLALDLTDIDLGALVAAVAEDYQALLDSHRLELSVQGDCHILGDAFRLERVVVNILSNAVKYSPKQSTIGLSVSSPGGKAQLVIADQGYGIAGDELQMIFQPFSRATNTRKAAKGFGMGLYTVKKIIEAHGGSIGMQSAPGQGTTVTIDLPLL